MARDRRQALEGVLLGTALGDALGLPAEGLSAPEIQRRFGTVDRFHLIGRTGFVSDDTEQSALLAQSLARSRNEGVIDGPRLVRAFRRSLVGWFVRLPFGIGLATVRASVRALLGFRTSGVASAGNGAAMRAAVLGVVCAKDAPQRLLLGREVARVTHLDPRAIEGAQFVAELAALASRAESVHEREALVRQALTIVRAEELRAALELAVALSSQVDDPSQAAQHLGCTGYVVHSLALASWAFARWGDQPLLAIQRTIAAGGDTDSIAAIVGAWSGALCGSAALPEPLLAAIQDGPFGPTHLRALARALVEGTTPPRFSMLAALLRNLLLVPVVLAHGLRRLLPW
ncbi:MAG: ADP-ribosylglycohydrolase family protein [Pseudomonadota bacterium]